MMTAIPLPLLAILLVASLIYLSAPRKMPRIRGTDSADIIVFATLIIGGLSLLIGIVALVTLLVLRVKGGITLSHRPVWLSVLLACLDMVLPIVIFMILMLAALSTGFH
jgi:hypothetical protein